MKKKLLIGILSALFVGTSAFGLAACRDNPEEEGSKRKPESYSQIDAPNDPDIKIDGKFDDDVYASGNLKWLSNTYTQNTSGTMPVLKYTGFTTSYGIYIAGEVADSNISYSDRGGWAPTYNSTWDIYFLADKKDKAPLTERQNRNHFQTDVLGADVYASTNCKRVRYATAVEGELNSGKTSKATIELFVPWSQFGFTAEEIPDEFGIIMQYLTTVGTNQTTTWLEAGTNLSISENYYRFGKHGFINSLSDNSVLGSTYYGKMYSAGWDFSREEEGIVTCTGGRSDQGIYFRNSNHSNFSMRATVIPIQSVYESSPLITFGMRSAQGHYYNVSLSAADNCLVSGPNETKNIGTIEMYATQNMPVWARNQLKSKKDNPLAARQEGTTLEIVKLGAKVYVFVNDEFFTMQNVPYLAGNAVASLGCNGMDVTFKDYAFEGMNADGAEARLNELGVYSVDAEAITVGGDVEVYADQEIPEVRFVAQSGYEIDTVTHNGVDITSAVKASAVGGKFVLNDLDQAADIKVSYKPIAEDNAATCSGKVTYADDGVLANILFTSETLNYACYAVTSQADGTFSIVLPKATWHARTVYNNNFIGEQTFNLQADITDAVLSCEKVSLGTWAQQVLPDGVANDKFAVTAQAVSGGVTYGFEAGFVVKINGHDYGFLFADSKMSVRRWDVSEEITVSYMVTPQSLNTSDFKIGLLYQNGVYTAMINDVAVREFTAYDMGSALEKYSELFGDKSKAIGFITRRLAVDFDGFEFSASNEGINEIMEGVTIDHKNITLSIDDSMKDMGSVSLSNGEVLVGGNSTLTITPAEGYKIVSVTRDAKDITGLLDESKGVYTAVLTDIFEDTVITVVFAEKESEYTVTGTFAYATGLYNVGDVVTVKSGITKGTVSGNSYSIGLPAGTHTVTLSSTRYKDVAVQVTVTENGATAATATFSTVKIDSHLNSAFTDNNDGSYTFGNNFSLGLFGGVTATDAFYVETTVAFNNDEPAENKMPGFLVYVKGNTEYGLFPYFHGTKLDLVAVSWNGASQTIETGLDVSQINTETGVKLGLAFNGGKYVLFVNDKACCEISQLSDGKFADLLSTESEKNLGLVTRRNAATVSGICYTFTASDIASKIESGKLTVSASSEDTAQGSVTLASNKVLHGGNAVLTVVPAENCTVKEVKLGGTALEADRYTLEGTTLTVKGITADAAITVSFSQAYAVTGTVSYASGLYSEGDSVTVSVGGVQAKVDGNTYKALVPAGTYTITFTSSLYLDEAGSVTVNESGEVTGDVNAQFRFAKLNLTQSSGWYKVNSWSENKVTNATDSFAIVSTLKYGDTNTGVAQAYGYYVKINNVVYDIRFEVSHDTISVFFRSSNTNESQDQVTLFSVAVRFRASGGDMLVANGEGVQLGLAFANNTYYILADGKTIGWFNAQTVTQKGWNAAMSGMFNEGEKEVGLRGLNRAADCKEVYYSVDGDAISAIIEGGKLQYNISVQAGCEGMGSFTMNSVSSAIGGVFWNEDITLSVTANSGYSLTHILFTKDDGSTENLISNTKFVTVSGDAITLMPYKYLSENRGKIILVFASNI